MKAWTKDGKLIVNADGKVILCDTCPCDTPPPTCCPYPYPDPNGYNGGPLYPDTDLPDNIDVTWGAFTTTLAKGTATPDTPFLGQTAIYQGTIDSKNIAIGYNSVAWYVEIYTPGEEYIIYFEFEVPCLIGEWDSTFFVVEDQFPDMLTATSTDGDITTLSRVSLCCWEGTFESMNEFNPGTFPISVCWAYGEDQEKYGWLLNIVNQGILWIKEDPQSSPVGTWATEPSWTITS